MKSGLTRRRRDRRSGILVLLGLLLTLALATPPAATAAALPAPDNPLKSSFADEFIDAAVDISELSRLRLRAPAQWLVDEEVRPLAAIRDLPFSPLGASDANRGIGTQVFWVRVRLTNPTGEPRRWVLQHETSYLDHLVIHYRDAGASWRSLHLSDRQPFAERPLPTPRLAWAHTTPAGSHTDLYLRLNQEQADTITLNLDLWEEQLFHQHQTRAMLASGIYYGMLFLTLLVTLWGGLLLRQRLWLWYSTFLAFSALLWGAIQGLSFQYLWPGSPLLHNQGFHLVFLGLPLAALQFSKGFLRTAQLMPRAHRLINWLQIGMLGGVGLRLLGYYEPVLFISYAALALLAALLPPLGWLAWRRGLGYARWYALAWIIYSVSLMISLVSATSDLLPWGMAPLFYGQLASLLEALLLFAALGEWLMGWDRERRAALRAAAHDTLTGLGNRRRLQQAFGELQQRRARDGQPWFVALIDLDSFKPINDTHGHEAGDRILQQFARLLTQHTRPEDVCVRYGGEEFAVLLQAPSLVEAQRIFERIRREFAEQPTRYGQQLIRHTFSAGLTQISPGEPASLAAILRRADTALYAAKSAGRNRIVTTEPDTVSTFPSPA